MKIENIGINLDEIKNENTRKAIQFLFNIIEQQATKIKKLESENQKLRDENNLLKGEQKKPDINPKNNGKGGGNISSEKDRKESRKDRRKKRAPKKEIVKVDRTEKLEINPNELPSDAVFKGYESVVIQDIQITRRTVHRKYYQHLFSKYWSATEEKNIGSSSYCRLSQRKRISRCQYVDL